MTIWIICSGRAAQPLPSSCDSAAFDALDAAEADSAIRPAEVRPLKQAGRPVYAAPGAAARETAALYLPDAEIAEEPLLSPLPRLAFCSTGRALPLWLWRFMAWLCAALGSGEAGRVKKDAQLRAEALLDRLESAGQDCVLICAASFAAVLADRARPRGYCQNRSGLFRFQPLERIMLSRRDAHCGGCAHNCLLSNPGCGVGRDKAARKSA